MGSLIQQPALLDWVIALGWTLLHVLWQGALVAAAYGVSRQLIPASRSQLRYAAGLAALAAMAVLPVYTFLSLAPWATTIASGPAVVAGGAVAATVAGADSGFSLEPWMPWIVLAWSLGVALHSVRATWLYWRLRRLCRLEAQPLPEWEATLRQLAQRFGVTRPVRLVRSAIVQTPSLIGWIAPVIMLPASVLVGLTPKQIELVIAHELGHIRRWDYAVNLLQIALETVLFYHPAVHWISREVRNDREACCDDLVLRLGADPMDYATTLASLEDLRGFTHAPQPAIPATGGFLLGRIRRIVGVDREFVAQPRTGGQSLMVLAIAGAVVLAAQPFTRNVLGELIDRDVAAAYEGAVSSSTMALTQAAALTVQRLLETTKPAPVAAPVADPIEIAPPAVAPVPVVLAPPVDAPRLAIARERTAPSLAFAPAIETPKRAARVGVPTLPTTTVQPPHALRAIRTAAPVYPRQAAIEGVEGQVTLSFYVDWNGRATQIAVTDATVPSTFDAAAIAALRDWRFASDSDMRGRRYTQTFDFTLDGTPISRAAKAGTPAVPTDDSDECLTPLGSRICRRSLNEVGGTRRDVLVDPATNARSEWLRVSSRR